MAKWRLILGSAGAPAWLVACVVFGGSSSGGLLVNALLQIAALPILVVILYRLRRSDVPIAGIRLLALVALAAALMALSLVPLPPQLWERLPGRASIGAGFDALGMARPALALTLHREGTIGALLSLLPPLAMFMLVLRASMAERFATVVALIVIAILSILFGVAQQVDGFDSDLYLYAITSRGGAVGFFANRNHLATLCLTTLPFLAALAVPPAGVRRLAGQPLAMLGLLSFLVVGALVVQSRAGWLLLPPTLVGCWLIYARRGKARGRWVAAGGLGLALALLAALFTSSGPNSLETDLTGVSPQDRRAIIATTWRAAMVNLPVGTGLGSFAQIYPQHEDVRSTTPRFVNHAHNDFVELLLEAGLPGVLLLGAFLIWWLRAARDAWSRRDDATPVMRASAVAIAVIVAHSLVDYPIRTAAIGAVAALAAALLTVAEPLQPGRSRYGRGAPRTDDRMISLSSRPARRERGSSGFPS